MTINLVSTALVADWTVAGSLVCTPLTSEQFAEVINSADEVRNFCGHPATTNVLNASGLNIPAQLVVTDSEGNPVLNRFGSPQGQFWDGVGVAVAARPRGGVRAAAQTGDTEVSLNDLEFLQFEFIRS